MDKTYQTAMMEQMATLEEELAELKTLVDKGQLTALMQRAAERTLQVLVEGCIGIAKQRLKAEGKVVPTEAREAFRKLKELGLDPSGTDWQRVIGLRNALVHDYLNLDPDIIKSIIQQGRYQSLFTFAYQHINPSAE